MFKIAKKIIILFFAGIFLISSAEANWITKKSDKSKETIKKEKKEKSEWIKKKKKEVKKNKEEYKKEEKKITSTIKSWITKKTKTKYLSNINDLPKGAIYFSGSNDTKNLLFYGYVLPDKKSKLIDGFYETSKGVGFFNDGKTTCQIGSTVLIVDQGELTSRVFGKCSNGLKFVGKTSQTKNSGWGQVKTSDGKERFNFDFNVNKTEIAKLYNKNKEIKSVARSLSPAPKSKINLDPKGNYYALLIGNSNYVKWASLKSPKNDVLEIEKILNSKYNFKKVITVIDGTEKQIMKAFKKLSNLTSDNDYVLIYYSGHGDNRGVNNYWIPVDGEEESGLGDWINTAEIGNYIKEEIPNKHIVLMSDSCYFDVKTKGNQITGDKKLKSYQKLLDRRAIMLIQSGSNEPVLDSTDGKHSMFAKSFISSIKNNENVVTMSAIIEDIYVSHGDMQQQPLGIRIKGWGDSGGDFLFISKNNLK